MPDITLTEEQYSELIANTITTTVATVSTALQQKVAERLNGILSGTNTPQKKAKGLQILLGELQNGVMEYD